MKRKRPVKPPPKPDPWRDQAATIRSFLDRQPLYEKLCGEIAYSLDFALRTAEVEIASVTSRAKSLASFLEKIERKQYASPFEDITDLAGVRVVHLYPTDFTKIESLLSEQFTIIEKVDKLAEHGDDRF